MRWQAVLIALPISSAAIALLELTRLPAPALAPERLVAALGHLVRSAVSTFAVPAVLLVATAAILALSRRPRLRAALLFGVGALQVACAREVLIEYTPFAHSLAANVGFVLLGLAAGGVYLLFDDERGGYSRGTGAVLCVASLLVARAHYEVYVGLYPTLHQCTLQLCFIGATTGAALVLSTLARPRVEVRVSLALAASLALVAMIELPATAGARPVVTAYTELGRGAGTAEALERDAAYLLPTEPPPPRDPAALPPDAAAEARFAARSGLPDLDFALDELDVLLILTDATRYDRTSLADPSLDTTPRLASLAARGAYVLTRAYSPSNGTFPSVASMLSMRPLSFAPVDVRRRFWRGALRDDLPTGPEVLAAGGRDTFWVGHDHARCFSENIRGVERGFARRRLFEEQPGDPAHADVDDAIATAAIEELEAADAPSFGLVFFVSPHDDYRGGYDAELRRMDAALGRVLDAVDLTRTIVIVAGDHGEAFGEHGHSHHLSSLYDEQIHVPLVVWVPGHPGGRRATPTSTAYVLPWLLLRGGDAEGAAARRVLREDVGPLMRELDGAVIAEMIGVRRQSATLIWDDTTVVYDVLADLPRLFDARRDPTQQHDLREADPLRFSRVLPFVRRYRRARYDGRRFRFLPEAIR